MGATVLVTGGAGFVGSHVCAALAEAGYRPVAYDSLCKGYRDAVQWGPLEVGDVLDGVRLAQVLDRHDPLGVIHCAGLIEAGRSVVAPAPFYQVNVLGTLSILRALAEREGERILILSSTAAVYGEPVSLPITESHPLAPVNPYGRSKMMAEMVLRDMTVAHGVRYGVLRYFNAAGADPRGRLRDRHVPTSHLIPMALEASYGKRQALMVFGSDYETEDGTCLRDYVHVSDLAEAHLAGLRHLLGGGPSFTANLGTGVGHSVRQVIRAVERVTGRPLPLVEAGRRAGDPAVLVADATLARSLLGWVPGHPDLEVQVAHANRSFAEDMDLSSR
ncbi:MAG: UDP-glucose 4-epimerase GalE [Rhodospirillum sp.]|nr:UDP-glucose 4-epimerase GalE [Rhodospirillum sp.]MCF8490623.1 UDP-glucose 4-epimerase GalE [Rhodospirillum sp.]MCF8498930.1 UDP-glucose 4-epimerase GalE [Rhodospirillum sp.]